MAQKTFNLLSGLLSCVSDVVNIAKTTQEGPKGFCRIVLWPGSEELACQVPGVVCTADMFSGCRERAWQNFGIATDP